MNKKKEKAEKERETMHRMKLEAERYRNWLKEEMKNVLKSMESQKRFEAQFHYIRANPFPPYNPHSRTTSYPLSAFSSTSFTLGIQKQTRKLSRSSSNKLKDWILRCSFRPRKTNFRQTGYMSTKQFERWVIALLLQEGKETAQPFL